MKLDYIYIATKAVRIQRFPWAEVKGERGREAERERGRGLVYVPMCS